MYQVFIKNNTASGIYINDLGGYYVTTTGVEDVAEVFNPYEISMSYNLADMVISTAVTINNGEEDLAIPPALLHIGIKDSFLSLLDTPTTYSGYKEMGVDVDLGEEEIKWRGFPGEYSTFVSLLDTPTTYSGYPSNRVPQVNDAGDAIEFVAPTSTISGSDLDREGWWLEDSVQSSTTKTAWKERMSLSFTPHSAGNYEVNFATMYSHEDTGVFCHIRVRVDDTITGKYMIRELYNFKYEDGAWSPFSGNFVVQLDATQHTVDIDYRTHEKSKAIYMKDSTIRVRRI